MEYLGGIENLSYKPIAGYNNFLKGNASFDVDVQTDFDKVLNQKISKNEDKSPVGNLMNRIGGAFGDGLNNLNDTKQAADRAQEALAMGEDISIHDVMIAAEKSSLGMNMALQLRNKLVQAYTEINNVRI